MKSKIKYVEKKSDSLRGVGRIVRVQFSKTGRTIYWDGRVLIPLEGFGFKANYCDENTSEEFWVSQPRRDGNDSLFPAVVEIDRDVREEYWLECRTAPDKLRKTRYRSAGKTKQQRERLEKSARRHNMDRRFRPS